MSYTILPMLPLDAPAVAKLHSESIKQVANKGKGITQKMVDIWSEVSETGHIRSLEFEDKFLLKLDDKELAVVGSTLKAKQIIHASAKQIWPQDTYAIAMFYADPKFIGQGYGTIMLEFLEHHLLSLSAKQIIVESSTYAESFYAKHGYIKIIDLEHPVRGGKVIVPAVLMSKIIN